MKKLAGFEHTGTTRYAAAMMISASVDYAAEQDVLASDLLQGYCDLCQDPDASIRTAVLRTVDNVLPKLKQDKDRNTIMQEVIKNIEHFGYS